MSNRIKTIAACGVGLTVGLVAGPVQSAMAGHTNRLLEGDLSGRAQVATDGTNQRNISNSTSNDRDPIWVK